MLCGKKTNTSDYPKHTIVKDGDGVFSVMCSVNF